MKRVLKAYQILSFPLLIFLFIAVIISYFEMVTDRNPSFLFFLFNTTLLGLGLNSAYLIRYWMKSRAKPKYDSLDDFLEEDPVLPKNQSNGFKLSSVLNMIFGLSLFILGLYFLITAPYRPDEFEDAFRIALLFFLVFYGPLKVIFSWHIGFLKTKN